jgi:hypothetical protein
MRRLITFAGVLNGVGRHIEFVTGAELTGLSKVSSRFLVSSSSNILLLQWSMWTTAKLILAAGPSRDRPDLRSDTFLP